MMPKNDPAVNDIGENKQKTIGQATEKDRCFEKHTCSVRNFLSFAEKFFSVG